MKKILWVVLILVSGCSVFAKQQKKKQPANEIISVAMRHTACFGRCPDFVIEINKNGMATYTGIRFTPDSGVYTKKIGVKRAAAIIKQFAVYRIDTCKDRYESMIADLPGIDYTIKYKNKTKKIQNANFGPPGLHQLRVLMDETIEQKTDESGLPLPLDRSWRKATGGRK